jgi:micrococcal nuclease
MRNIFLFVGFLLLFITTACSLGNDESGSRKNGLISAKVIKVIDGDTIKVLFDGKEETVRFLLVDTPEISDSRWDGPQPFALKAKDFIKDLLNGKTVELEVGISERDKYGRLLAYIWLEGESAQKLLLERGFARVAYVYVPNVKYVDEYREIQRIAQEKELGIWSVENYATDRGDDPSVVEEKNSLSAGSQEQESLEEECNIKGNINSKGQKIYHVPGGRYYAQTKPEQWFCNEEEAQAAGFRKSKE